MNIFRVNFQELYRRHLCRHSQFGLNIWHLIAVAGILIGLNFNAVEPYMGEPLMLRGFAVVIIGGLGNIRGALAAGLALGFVEVMTAGYLSSNLKDAAGFAAMVVTLWLRPAGLFGQATTR